MKVISSEVTETEMRVSLQLAGAAMKSAIDICKREKVGRNVGVTALCIAVFNLARKCGLPVETLVEVLRELATDETKTVKA